MKKTSPRGCSPLSNPLFWVAIAIVFTLGFIVEPYLQVQSSDPQSLAIPKATLTPVPETQVPPTQVPKFEPGTNLTLVPEDPASPSAPWDFHVISSGGQGADGVRLVDVNGDRRKDVISAFEHSGQVMIFQQPGLDQVKQPWPFVNVGSFPSGEDAIGVDLDGDEMIDIVSMHEGDTLGIYVHWAPTDPALYLYPEAWIAPQLIPSSSGRAWMFAIQMDVNKDGHGDIVAGSKDDYFNDRNSIGDLGWFEAPSQDKRGLDAWEYHSIGPSGWPMSIIAYDVNGDGHDDLIVTDRNAGPEHMGARWLRNPGADWEQPWRSRFLGEMAGTRPTFMSSGDFDGDGLEEFVIPLSDEGQLIILRRPDLGLDLLSIGIDFSQDFGTMKAVEVGDIDNDGQMDIIVTFVGGQYGVIWLSYTGDPFADPWVMHVVFEGAGKFDNIALYDVDQDGDKDIFTTEEQLDLGVLWFENPSVTGD
ncbi:MAG: VCBS repeat-containing protein [Anaerolineales bacterium]